MCTHVLFFLYSGVAHTKFADVHPIQGIKGAYIASQVDENIAYMNHPHAHTHMEAKAHTHTDTDTHTNSSTHTDAHTEVQNTHTDTQNTHSHDAKDTQNAHTEDTDAPTQTPLLPQHLKSVISFDQGGSWHPLAPPVNDSQGFPIPCVAVSIYLIFYSKEL